MRSPCVTDLQFAIKHDISLKKAANCTLLLFPVHFLLPARRQEASTACYTAFTTTLLHFDEADGARINACKFSHWLRRSDCCMLQLR